MSGYVIMGDGLPHIPMDMDSQLNYTFDWRDWLAQEANDSTIASATVALEAGLQEVERRIGDGLVTVFLKVGSGGMVGGSYRAVCRITTAPDGLIEDRTIVLDITER